MPHAIFGTYYTKKNQLLFTRKLNLTGHLIILFAKFGNPTLRDSLLLKL